MRLSHAVLAASAAELAVAQKCSPLHFIYARATTEPPMGVDNANKEQFEAAANKGWSKGFGAAGKSIFGNITALIPEATGWPVHYPASWSGCASENKGIDDILDQITTKAKECPDQKYVLGGHSQGGVVTARAIPKIPADIMKRVIAVVGVGSPNCPESVKDRCRSYCNKGDGICVPNAKSSKVNGKCDGAGGGAVKGKGKGAKSAAILQEEKRDIHAEVENISLSQYTSEAISRIQRRQYITGPITPETCNQAEVPEKEHVHKKGGTAHLAYNADGYYITAAACYVYKKYKGL